MHFKLDTAFAQFLFAFFHLSTNSREFLEGDTPSRLSMSIAAQAIGSFRSVCLGLRNTNKQTKQNKQT